MDRDLGEAVASSVEDTETLNVGVRDKEGVACKLKLLVRLRVLVRDRLALGLRLVVIEGDDVPLFVKDLLEDKDPVWLVLWVPEME